MRGGEGRRGEERGGEGRGGEGSGGEESEGEWWGGRRHMYIELAKPYTYMTNESTFYHATYISMHSFLRTLTISYVYVRTTCVAVWVGINISNYGQTECQHIGVCGEDED